jgi:hypothetical protein
MAEGQTVIWTALPHGRAGDTPTSPLRLSVHVAPQLWNTDPNAKVMPLSDFPDWFDFPAAVAAMTFQVEFDGLLLPATVTSAPPRSDVWKALFDAATQVFPYRFEDDDVSAGKYLVLETGVLAGAIAAAYAHVATDPALGAGADLPGVGPLAATPGIAGIARPSRPERPFEPPDRPSDPVPAPRLPVPPEERPGCLGWLFRLLCWLARYLPWLRRPLKGRCPPAGICPSAGVAATAGTWPASIGGGTAIPGSPAAPREGPAGAARAPGRLAGPAARRAVPAGSDGRCRRCPASRPGAPHRAGRHRRRAQGPLRRAHRRRRWRRPGRPSRARGTSRR